MNWTSIYSKLIVVLAMKIFILENCTSSYSKLIVVLAMKIFILENCTSSWWVISLIFSFTIQSFNITLVYNVNGSINI